MPISNFTGSTYVAFSDLNGFKEMMRNHENAARALNKLYNTVYRLKDNREYSRIQTLAVSDCAISFVDKRINDNNDNNTDLEIILGFLKELHTAMLNANYLITSSVARGQFSYQERIELPGLGKNMLFGNAYLTAYLNNAKCPPGSIVLVYGENDKPSILNFSGQYREFLKDIQRGIKGFHFLWALASADLANDFEVAYRDTYKLKYEGMISVYKSFLGQR